MKIDLLVGHNPYNSTLHFSKSFSNALQRQGVQTRLHWIDEGHFFHAFYEIAQNPPHLTCSFSDIHQMGNPIGDLWHIPHLSLLVDPAIYFLHQLRGKYSWISCVDEGDVDFIRALNFERVFYLPHGAERSLITSSSNERPYPVAFFGSCPEYETKDEIVISASKRVLSPENISILVSLKELGIPDEQLPFYHFQVDAYTRFKDRVELLRALKSHQVHIWGSGPWEKYVPHAMIHPSVEFDQVIEIMKKTKVVVNSSPRFKRGFHERIIYGFICGAAVLSTNKEEGFTYQHGQWEDLCFDNWQEVAIKGQKRMLAEHTWDHRAQTLLSAINFIK